MAEVAVSQGGWSPQQYDRFKAEREQPFFDLAALVERGEGQSGGMRVVDLGCGDGRLTAWLHRELGATETVGIDSSPEMFAKTAVHAGGGVRFEQMDILDAVEAYPGEFDLVFSNAALQWILGHDTLFARVARLLRPGGQIAVQMPSNRGHLSHQLPALVAAEEPFRAALVGWVRDDPVETPEHYAALLHDLLGCERQVVRYHVYGHELPETRAVVEWVKGSVLTAYLSRLPVELHAPYLERYTERLVAGVGEHAPYFYLFPRVLFWGRLPA